jgi:hypothetical protein
MARTNPTQNRPQCRKPRLYNQGVAQEMENPKPLTGAERTRRYREAHKEEVKAYRKKHYQEQKNDPEFKKKKREQM